MRPGKPGFRIKHVWAVIALDPKDDSEGVPGALLGATWFPLIAADEDRLRSIKEMAQQISRVGAPAAGEWQDFQ